jgi:hypothetical protein
LELGNCVSPNIFEFLSYRANAIASEYLPYHPYDLRVSDVKHLIAGHNILNHLDERVRPVQVAKSSQSGAIVLWMPVTLLELGMDFGSEISLRQILTNPIWMNYSEKSFWM